MVDPKRLLTDFFGPNAGSIWDQAATKAKGAIGGIDPSKAGTFATGAAAGGILGLLLGCKKAKKLGGNLLAYGGAAVLGGLAYKAWQNWQQNKQPAEVGATADPVPQDSAFDPISGQGTDNQPFALAIVRAMVHAAKADGHMDVAEQRSLFQRIESLGLSSGEKAFIFEELGRPTDLNAIAALARSQEQAAELWLAARLAIDPDDTREMAYLDALGAKLYLPAPLLAHLEAQAHIALSAPQTVSA